ncbi:MAG TPA: GNAT family N-acetyltransferase [Saprospiraceae bacterium]|nr:GNAT family N-acetyltransferase [Saprospiraceae bacterium]
MIEKIRPVQKTDVNFLKTVVDSSELFPSEYLEEMMTDYFNNPDTEEIWYTYEENGLPVAIGYCIPEKLTVGTYNLLALGVKKDFQGKGIAAEMMRHIEQLLTNKDGRILIIETSSHQAQDAARRFYTKMGYAQEAVIRDFWSEGEDKIVFWKKLL